MKQLNLANKLILIAVLLLAMFLVAGLLFSSCA